MALNEFEGTVMLVSHDRAAACGVRRILAGLTRRRRPFDGDLDDYQRYLLDEAKRVREEAAAAHKLRGT
jgi:ATP-binding cassette subfamily F protein 3